MNPIIEWTRDNTESIKAIQDKTAELREYRDKMEKVLFDKLRNRKSNPLIGTS